MERVKHERHEHETAWAADRCTPKIRRGWAQTAHLVNVIKQDMARPDYKVALPADPFEGFRS